MVRDSKKRTDRRRYLKIVGSGVAASLAGCSGGDGGGGDDGGGEQQSVQQGGATTTETTKTPEELSMEEWRKMASEKAAEEGGTVVYYGVGHGYDEVKQLLNKFTYDGIYEPLELEIVQGSGSELIQKYTRQQQQNNQKADVLDITQVTELLDQGVKFGDLTNVPGFQQAPDSAIAPPHIGGRHVNPYGIAYNTNRISEPPQSWEDLLDDRFKGEIIIDGTPSTLPTARLSREKGWGYVEKLAKQNPQFNNSTIASVQAVANGNAGVFPLATFSTTLRNRLKGLPIDLAKATEVSYPTVSPLMMAHKPAHTWSAKLFIDWYVRPDNREAQAADTGDASLDRKVIKAPDDMKDSYKGELTGVDIISEIPESASEVGEKWREHIGAPSI